MRRPARKSSPLCIFTSRILEPVGVVMSCQGVCDIISLEMDDKLPFQLKRKDRLRRVKGAESAYSLHELHRFSEYCDNVPCRTCWPSCATASAAVIP